MDVEDAKNALNLGVDGIIVSNHGGRQLDGTLSSILALNKISKLCESRTEVYLDGGIRSGTDIMLLFLGAKAIFVGRPYLYGLSAKGGEGVKDMIKIFKQEMDITLALCGENNINNLSKNNLVE